MTPTGLERILDVLESIRERLGQRADAASTSSVEIKTSTRGTDVAVKVYCTAPDVPVHEAGDAAIDEYRRLLVALNQLGANAFGAEVERRR